MVYTIAGTGTVISAHYCMGDIAALSVGEREAHGCEFCGMEDEGCCHDLPQVVKMECADILSQSFIHVDFHPAPKPTICPGQMVPSFNSIQLKPDFSADHRVLRPPTFILNCNFRI